jgi:hypothetical protein
MDPFGTFLAVVEQFLFSPEYGRIRAILGVLALILAALVVWMAISFATV